MTIHTLFSRKVCQCGYILHSNLCSSTRCSLGPTEAETLRALSEEEQVASALPGFMALHDVSPVGFVAMGLELEDVKYVPIRDIRAASGLICD